MMCCTISTKLLAWDVYKRYRIMTTTVLLEQQELLDDNYSTPSRQHSAPSPTNEGLAEWTKTRIQVGWEHWERRNSVVRTFAVLFVESRSCSHFFGPLGLPTGLCMSMRPPSSLKRTHETMKNILFSHHVKFVYLYHIHLTQCILSRLYLYSDTRFYFLLHTTISLADIFQFMACYNERNLLHRALTLVP